MSLLGLDQFPLAKELLRNRAKIVWVTKLRQAQVSIGLRAEGWSFGALQDRAQGDWHVSSRCAAVEAAR